MFELIEYKEKVNCYFLSTLDVNSIVDFHYLLIFFTYILLCFTDIV